MDDPESVLAFWFEGPMDSADAVRQRVKTWFMGPPEFDRAIAERFGAVFERARRGELDAWAATPRGRLALIVVLDQFSRNLHRGTPLAFAQDLAARVLAIEGMDAGMDRTLGHFERRFFALPLSHAEDLALQERGVRYAEALAAEAAPMLREISQIGASQARKHRDTIARFGRFPQRNAALGRASTPEEIAFLGSIKDAPPPL